jgi:hypothetical protein
MPMPIHLANVAASHGRRCRAGRGGAGVLSVGERYLTQVQAARAAGVSRDTIIRARRAGRLAGCRMVEGRWLVPASSLAASGLGPDPRLDVPGPEVTRRAEPEPDNGAGVPTDRPAGKSA